MRPVAAADLDAFFAHQADPIACELAGFTSRDRASFDAHWRRLLGDPGERLAAVIAAVIADGELVGNIGAWGPADERLVGYWIAREHWHRGIATRALTAFLAREPVRPLFAHVVPSNAPSIRVLEKCGFVLDTRATNAEELTFRRDRPGADRGASPTA